jgi:hypothetical protein
MSSKTVRNNSEKALFAAFRKVLRGLSNDEEKSRREEIRAGKRPAHQNERKKTAKSGGSPAKAGHPSGNTNRPMSKSVTEGRSKAAGSSKEQSRKGSKTAPVKKTKSLSKPLEGGSVARLSPSRLRRKAHRQDKQAAHDGGAGWRGLPADIAKDELLHIAALKKHRQSKAGEAKGKATPKVSREKAAKAKAVSKKPFVTTYSAFSDQEWKLGQALHKSSKKPYTFYSWTVDSQGKSVRVKRDYRKCVMGVPRVVQKQPWLGGSNAADLLSLQTVGKTVKTVSAAKSRRSKLRSFKKGAPQGVSDKVAETPPEKGPSGSGYIVVEILRNSIHVNNSVKRLQGLFEAGIWSSYKEENIGDKVVITLGIHKASG